MSSVIEAGAAAARAILEKRAPAVSKADRTALALLMAEAFAKGALWGIERAQHAAAITHAKVESEIGEAS